MRIFCIFDDIDEESRNMFNNSGIELDVLEKGKERPDGEELRLIIEKYDGMIIGTGQKIPENYFKNVNSKKVIGTASIGTDHIQVPQEKKELVYIVNAPLGNVLSVAEYVIGSTLSCLKKFEEAIELYKLEKNNKFLRKKAEDLHGKTFGVIGAGNVAKKVIDYVHLFGCRIICYTAHPQYHSELSKQGVEFVSLDELVQMADVISLNLPDTSETKGIISESIISKMKNEAIFVSISRKGVIDIEALKNKAYNNPFFYVFLDVDVDAQIAQYVSECSNFMATPHIAGGTVESRVRMFQEVAQKCVGLKNMFD